MSRKYTLKHRLQNIGHFGQGPMSITIFTRFKLNKILFPLRQILFEWSQQNYARLNSWAVVKYAHQFESISWPVIKLQQNEFTVEFELRW